VASHCRLTSPTGECSRMHRKVSSDWLPSYIKATRPVLEIFKMAGYFPDSPRMSQILCWDHVQVCCEDTKSLCVVANIPFLLRVLIINVWQINKQAIIKLCVPHVASGWPRSEPKWNYTLLKSGTLADTSQSENGITVLWVVHWTLKISFRSVFRRVCKTAKSEC
jgi:hypothetical protein